jgi:AraC family transcriptional regulator
MCASGTIAALERLKPLEQASLTPQDHQSPARDSAPTCLGFGYLANCLARLLETATRELERDLDAARASLATASNLLQAEVERYSGTNGSARGGLAPWQMLRVRAFIESNLHRAIHIRDLSEVAQRSPAYFSRSFKLAVGESPHAYLVRRRLERACDLMVISAVSLSEIALRVGFSDQAHLCRHFRAAFGQSPASWRREHVNPRGDNPGTSISHARSNWAEGISSCITRRDCSADTVSDD